MNGSRITGSEKWEGFEGEPRGVEGGLGERSGKSWSISYIIKNFKIQKLNY